MKFTSIVTTAVVALSVLSLTACQSNQNQTQGYIEGQFTYIAPQVGGTLQNLAVHRGEKLGKGNYYFS